jgi:hypothetical protein
MGAVVCPEDAGLLWQEYPRDPCLDVADLGCEPSRPGLHLDRRSSRVPGLAQIANSFLKDTQVSKALDIESPAPHTEQMIRLSGAQYFWFSFPTNSAEGGARAI